MVGENLTIDPRSEDATNAPLRLTSQNNGVVLLEHAYPVSEEERQRADSVDTEGSLIASRKPVNRTITAKVRVTEWGDDSTTFNRVKAPRPDVDTTGWTSSTGAGGTLNTFEWAEMPDEPGEYGLHYKGTQPNDTTERGYGVTMPTGGSTWYFAATPGETLIVSCDAYCVNTAAGTDKGFRLDVVWYEADGTTSIVQTTGDVVPDTIAERVRLREEVTAPANAGWGRILVRQLTNTATDVVEAYYTKFSVGPEDYFDGDTPGCKWEGTPLQSRSLRATYGERYQAGVADIEAKVGKLQREGGTLRRVLPTGTWITFDVVGATIDVPADKRWVNRLASDVTITLECLPYGRETPVRYTASETTLPVLDFTVDDVPGSVDALGELLVTNDASSSQNLLLWGLQSRDLDTSLDWFFEAEDNAGSATSPAVGPSGASGSATNKTAYDSALDDANWHNGITLASTALVGSFRAFVRVQAPATNTGTVSFRMRITAHSTTNTIITPTVTHDPGEEGHWTLVDLGYVSFAKAKRGAQSSSLSAQALSTVTGDDIYWDWLLLVPIDEGSGEANSIALAQDRSFVVTDESALREDSTGVWERAPYEGDFLRVPPSGAEGRKTRFIVKMSRASLDSGGLARDDGTDDLSGELVVTPRWLVVPAP